MSYFGIGCLQIVVVCVLCEKGYGARSLDDYNSEEDALVNQLPKYLNRRPYSFHPFREEDSIIHPKVLPYAADKHNLRLSQVRLRPHSRLVEELESEDDLVNQMAQFPLEEEELQDAALDLQHHSFMGPREEIFVMNTKHKPAPKPLQSVQTGEEQRRSTTYNNPPQKHRQSKSKWGGKFGYSPAEPEFFAPVDSFIDTDETNRPQTKKSEAKNQAEVQSEVHLTEVSRPIDPPSTESQTEPTTNLPAEIKNSQAQPSFSRTKSPENYEIVEGYFQKHNVQGFEAVNESVPVTNASTVGNSRILSSVHTVGEPVAHAHVQEVGTSRNALFDFYFTVLVAGCTAALVGALIAAGVCWYRLQRGVKAAADVEYPAAYRGSNTTSTVTTPESRDRSLVESRASSNSSSSGDRRLAQSAHMFHYQHQKQQVLAMERNGDSRHGSASGIDSDDDNEEGDYTVYECPGLAPTGEMEVKNPMFLDDPTPLTPTMKKESSDL